MSHVLDVRNSLIEPYGFGDYPLPEGKTFAQVQCAAKVHKIAFAILFGLLAVGSVILTHISVPLSVLFIFGFTVFMIRKIIETMGVGNRAPPTGELFPAEKVAIFLAVVFRPKMARTLKCGKKILFDPLAIRLFSRAAIVVIVFLIVRSIS